VKEDKIVEILKTALNSVYCDTCGAEDDTDCEGCHRKMMNWSLSENTARRLAEKIMEVV